MSRTRDLGKVVSGNVNLNLPSAAVDSDFTVDTSTFVVDATNNRVGVGTATPYYQIDNRFNDSTTTLSGGQGGDWGGSGIRIENENTTAGTMALAHFRNEISDWHIGSKLVSNDNSTFVFLYEGAEKLRIASDGNVGIGTNSPAGVLDVQSNAGSLSATNDITAEFHRADGVYSPRLQIRHSTLGSDINHTWGSNAGILTLSIAGTERMRIDSAGRITMPYQPAFTVYRLDTSTSDASYQISATSGNITDCVNTAETNVGSHYNLGTNRFTAPVSGRYFFNFNIALAGRDGTIADNTVGYGFIVNGSKRSWTTYTSALNMSQSTTGFTANGNIEMGSPSMSAILELNANDYVQVGWQNISKPLNVRSFIFSGYLLS